MIVYKITIENTVTEFNNLVAAETFALQNNISINSIEQETRESSVDLASIIDAALIQKQSNSLPLLREIFVKNTLAGISTAQSKELFRTHMDIIICLLVGAYPTAYAMLDEAQPQGFMTQERLNEWKEILSKYL